MLSQIRSGLLIYCMGQCLHGAEGESAHVMFNGKL